MSRKLLAALLLLLGLLAPSAAFSPAEAGDTSWRPQAARDITWGKAQARKGYSNDVTHAADDSGWAGPIHIVCNSGTHRYLYRGESSAFDQKACSISGVSHWIVPAGHTYYCKNYLPPYQNRYIYVGSTDVPSASSWKCYDQKAL